MEDSSAADAVPGGERASFLTVEEAAAVLRIGRTAAYEATRRYRSVVLPAEYAQAHVRLGYASTVHGVQGEIVDISHTLVSRATTHRRLYVGATRGRDANHLAVITETADLDDARDTLEWVLANDRVDVSVIVRRRELADAAPPPMTAQERLDAAQQHSWRPRPDQRQHRYHAKPCDTTDLRRSLRDAVRHYWRMQDLRMVARPPATKSSTWRVSPRENAIGPGSAPVARMEPSSVVTCILVADKISRSQADASASTPLVFAGQPQAPLHRPRTQGMLALIRGSG